MTILTVLLANLVLLTIPVAPAAYAAPSCSNGSVAAAEVYSAQPWAQQLYGLDRLSGLVDGAGQTVAVIDSGVDAAHPQLSGAVTSGIDVLDSGGNGKLDCVGHGTAVASIIAARPVSGVAFRGIAPAATILPVRVSERQDIEGTASGRSASLKDLAQAVIQAVDRKATVLNLSLVTTQDDPSFRQAIKYAVDHNVVVVAAAGNSHSKGDPTAYPAAYPGVLGVGAVGQDGKRVSESQVGTYVDLVAPGDQVVAAVPGRGHTAYQGTSFAAPFVSAAAALVRQYYPDLSAEQVISRLVATTDPTFGGSGSKEYGAGLVNPYRAVTQQLSGDKQKAALLNRASSGADAVARNSARVRSIALTTAATGGVVVLLIIIAVSALPRGIRRKWRAGLATPQPVE